MAIAATTESKWMRRMVRPEISPGAGWTECVKGSLTLRRRAGLRQRALDRTALRRDGRARLSPRRRGRPMYERPAIPDDSHARRAASLPPRHAEASARLHRPAQPLRALGHWPA